MTCVIGIDIAKHTFDIAKPLERDKNRTKAKVAKTPKGFPKFSPWFLLLAPPPYFFLLSSPSVYHEHLDRQRHYACDQACVTTLQTNA